jgi:hypothetical protein
MTERMRNLLAITLLGTCAAITACSGGGSAPRAAQPAPEPAELIEGDLRIRASAVPTMQLPESVARGYGIERGEDRVLLLVGMRRGTDGNEVALTGTVDARVTDLQSRTQAIPMRALHSGPSTGSGQAPSTGSGQAPSTGSWQAPSTGSGQAPSTGPGEALVDYIGIIVVTPPETLRFHVQATPQGEPPRTIDFVREFYP